ncbi:dihydrolipoyllysine-residue succinyltransferase, E2 component of oxoglutarate dehydrogenase (succinyl-transferring) complex [Candidatus Endolissoclinum faulkneri L2]|uniref:Dihydrolipoyllysine-residue succinyltransferase component of 2-oxoglutarate dehydrogenase complex n=1 Tax=Candidatus Endolissoclinum faulkneri L2 TaxID=1193729 RepID=K7YQ06_9PROT|nr:2-oxoglutarate dehydrogenase complex dihydrolipoyllysine-residue succinyltransferase [Candidatus Endolissoclinum faulkneri]AFX99637.1 dihydrolipoyllysine-residue succinyltransferase, E2 component of oxoglutarate dehydrogenase (succinyl-transferring) complex [Candidatus Endolissoclinum faulkneri L2]
MATEIKVPALGDYVSEATIAKWIKSPGDVVNADEPLLELETDKVTIEVNAPSNGILTNISAKIGDKVKVNAVLGMIEQNISHSIRKDELKQIVVQQKNDVPVLPSSLATNNFELKSMSPAVRKLVEENNLDPTRITPTGKDGRLIRKDVLQAIAAGTAKRAFINSVSIAEQIPHRPENPREERVKMTRLRQVIANRLKEAQSTAATLTTFNEVDMTTVMNLRKQHKNSFEKKHGVRLGFMSFFVKACVHALRQLPVLNAEIYYDEIIYKNFFDIGVAVGTATGLVVPILRDADQLSFATVEKTIYELGVKARDGKLSINEMQGGTFTISNGGIYGSMMSTPILNPPQSGILGMHKIQPRPIVIGNSVEIRQMMYLALSYDHRIVDGREAVTFLVKVKDAIEDPNQLLLDL